jgi:hypothetical protein
MGASRHVPAPQVPFLHEPAEVGMDARYAARSATGKYRTTNRGKDVRRVMPLTRSQAIVDVDRLKDEHVDLRSLQDATAGHAPAQATS